MLCLLDIVQLLSSPNTRPTHRPETKQNQHSLAMRTSPGVLGLSRLKLSSSRSSRRP